MVREIRLRAQPSQTAPEPSDKPDKTRAHRLSRRATGNTGTHEGEKEHTNRSSLLNALSVSQVASAVFHGKRPSFGKMRSSRVLSVLGREWFAEFTAVNIFGNVIWCNFELARELGFDVPSANRMTPQFHQELIDALSYRVLGRGEDAGARKTITLYADKYGGEGVSPALGAGRAGFLPYANLCIKGLGHTPLFKHDDPDDFEHSHGGVPMDEAFAETLFGEVNVNLFSKGSSRILAIIDYGEFITFPDGQKVARVLAVRAGEQLRPGHLLAKRIWRPGARLEMFLRMTRETGQLVMRRNPLTGRKVADIKATMLRVVDDHARTSAEQFRWRMIHGALSSSNMETSGAMLDLATQSTQPRTAPTYVLPDYPDSAFGREHIERAVQLRPVYTALTRAVPKSERAALNVQPIDLEGEMAQAYQKHLEVQLLSAVGLKTAGAERIQANDADLSRRFTDVVLRMTQLWNQGMSNVGKRPVATVSCLDVFNLLQEFPAIFFAAPGADHSGAIRKQLSPVVKGNRFQVARKQAIVEVLIEEFARVYRELMKACESLVLEFYGDKQSMQDSIRSRAAFENQPLSRLTRLNVYRRLGTAVATYKANGDAAIFHEAIDATVTASLRRVDGLLIQGTSRRLQDGGFELQRRTIDGVNYSVRAWNPSGCRRLHVSLGVARDGEHYLTSLPGDPRLSGKEIRSLRYKFTTDKWTTSAEVSARLVHDKDQLMVEVSDITVFPRIGRLAGAFYVKGGRQLCLPYGVTTLGEYLFAIPDERELMLLKMPDSSRRKTRIG